MQRLHHGRRRHASQERAQAGQGLVEYALIFVLVVIVCIVALSFFGDAVTGQLSTVGTSV